MELRNIHFTPPAAADAPAAVDPPPAPAPQPQDVRMRGKRVAVSPVEEFQLRGGQTQPIADSLAAMILSCTGRCEVGLKGVKIDRDELGGVRWYGHPDSILCNDLSQRERRLFYAINRQDPTIAHILDEDGRHLETLPEKGTPGVLDTKAMAKEYADNQRVKKRAAAHLQNLHGKETAAALQHARENAAAMQRVTQILPAAATPGVEPAPSAVGDRIQQGAARINKFRQTEKAAIGLGRAITASRGSRWDDQPASRTQQPTKKQSW